MNRLLLPALVLVLSAAGVNAEDSRDTARTPADSALTEAQNRFMDNQAAELLTHAGTVLATHPPAWPEPAPRKSALLVLDGVLHDVFAPRRTPVREFYCSRFIRAVEEIERTEVKEGMRIWKLYNHGFVVRTKSVTIVFDIVYGPLALTEWFPDTEKYMNRLADQCDVLFVSHWHGDHADAGVAELFADRGKPVVAPDGVWEGKPFHASVTRLERNPRVTHRLAVAGRAPHLEVTVLPGHQGNDVDNNVYLVRTPEQMMVAHLGDQFNWPDLKWIDGVAAQHTVDVLLPNCWTMDIARTVQGFAPKVVITGHENEMNHTVEKREPYWHSYKRRETGSDTFGGKAGVGYDAPLVLMTWGESYYYHR